MFAPCVRVCVTVCALIFAGFIFRGFAISAFLNSRLCVPIVLVLLCRYAKNSGVEIFTGEIFADIQSESVYHNSIRQL